LSLKSSRMRRLSGLGLVADPGALRLRGGKFCLGDDLDEETQGLYERLEIVVAELGGFVGAEFDSRMDGGAPCLNEFGGSGGVVAHETFKAFFGDGGDQRSQRAALRCGVAMAGIECGSGV